MSLSKGDAFQARATHASHRAVFHRLGLSVGIAIALSGCQTKAEYDARMRQQAQRDAYTTCLYDATGPFGSASIEVVRDCRKQTYGAGTP